MPFHIKKHVCVMCIHIYVYRERERPLSAQDPNNASDVGLQSVGAQSPLLQAPFSREAPQHGRPPGVRKANQSNLRSVEDPSGHALTGASHWRKRDRPKWARQESHLRPCLKLMCITGRVTAPHASCDVTFTC